MAPINRSRRPDPPPLSFATRTGDLLFVSGIPSFDENGALPARAFAIWSR